MLKQLSVALFLLWLPPIAAAQETSEVIVYTQSGECPFKLELATTPAAREHGLMKRTSLAPNDGMLFVFPKASDVAFWMKDTGLALDMIFIDPDYSITAIDADTKPYSLNPHRAGHPTLAVIELDAGRAAKDGIEVGDKVRYELPAEMPVH